MITPNERAEAKNKILSLRTGERLNIVLPNHYNEGLTLLYDILTSPEMLNKNIELHTRTHDSGQIINIQIVLN